MMEVRRCNNQRIGAVIAQKGFEIITHYRRAIRHLGGFGQHGRVSVGQCGNLRAVEQIEILDMLLAHHAGADNANGNVVHLSLKTG